ncbi:MAG: YceI family protein [Candidatus Berkiella sp.]
MKYSIIIGTLISSFQSHLYAAQTYSIDPLHSQVLWHVSHFDFSNPSGKWMAEGTLVLDNENLQNSKVNVTIKVADIITGLNDLDQHLKGKLFFDIKNYPTATFVSDKIDLLDKKVKSVHGMLTVHGVTKPITLDVKLNKIGLNPVNDRETVGFSANTMLKRSDFGITTMLPGIGDDVKIQIEIEAYKPNQNGK